MSTCLELIQKFLRQKRIAMIGISSDPKNFSVHLFEEMRRRGYDMVPVNPKMAEAAGRRCFGRVQDIQPPVEAAVLMTSPKVTDRVVRDCADAGITLVWMYRAGGQGSVSGAAVQYCSEHGIQAIAGECPLMFMPNSGTVHRAHGWIRKITGRYPRSSGQKAA